LRRFPLRTLLLMALALLAFIRLWYLTGAERRTGSPPPSEVAARAPEEEGPGAQACRTLERALEEVLKAPEDPGVLARAKELLEACPGPPARACALGEALEAHTGTEAGTTPLRELEEALCQRCPAASNPCAERVTRAVRTLGGGEAAEVSELRWSLEHAGPGKARACVEVTRSLLAPAAVTTKELTEGQREVLEALAPPCAKAKLLPRSVLHAAVVEGGVPSLAPLATGLELGEAAPLKPDEVRTAETKGPRWEREGAWSAEFEPPVRLLTEVRVKASGGGTVRAVVRTVGGLGLVEPDTEKSFVLPTACRFRGTGEWEMCTLPVPLLDVEALSVFPEKESLEQFEVEALGER
jgi:hypothetical protein